MSLFRSKLTKLEAFVDTKAAERKPEQLAEAQAQLDGLNADVLLVPKTDTIKTAADLQKHLDKLTADLKAAQDSETKLKADMETLRGARVVDTARQTADKKKGGDDLGERNATKEAEAVVNDPDAPWNALADEMGFSVPTITAKPAAQEEKKETPNTDDK